MVVQFSVALLGLGLALRIASLQVMPDVEQGYEFLQYQGQVRTIREQEIPAYRGAITDRNGEPLAISTPLVALWLNPGVFATENLPVLAEALDAPVAELEKRLARYQASQFMYLRRGMSPAEAQAILDLNLTGLNAQTEYRRFYPEAEVTAQVVGLTDIDDRGIEGVELGFDSILRGKSGSERIVKDLRGQVVERLGVVGAVEPGSDIQLTIDLRLQYIAYRALKAAVAKHRAKAASMVIMDPSTGEVLAMVSQPSFNPNSREFNPNAMRNRAVVDSFEPGSIVKPFTLAAALEQGIVQPSTRINTAPGYMRVDGNLIQDPVNYGELDVSTVLAKSSQIGTVKIAMEMEPETLHDMFQRVGLGTPPGMGFPGELGGELPQRSRWSDIQQATFAFGYGLTATSLQLAQAYSVLANDGVRVSPRLVRGTAGVPDERVMDSGLAATVREMMVDVVDHGTGTRAQIEGYAVAGKTGTGHLVGAGGYEEDRYASLFAGMVPAHNPELVAVVVITDPQAGEYFGGLVAAPVFSEVLSEALRIMRIAPDEVSHRVAKR
ncbi:MAG: peptidoglycan D,D-transpeptidase FtsI family protein [Porticoccaceae bacterium]